MWNFVIPLSTGSRSPTAAITWPFIAILFVAGVRRFNGRGTKGGKKKKKGKFCGISVLVAMFTIGDRSNWFLNNLCHILWVYWCWLSGVVEIFLFVSEQELFVVLLQAERRIRNRWIKVRNSLPYLRPSTHSFNYLSTNNLVSFRSESSPKNRRDSNQCETWQQLFVRNYEATAELR